MTKNYYFYYSAANNHLPTRKEPAENGEIVRESDFGDDRILGSTRFPGAPGTLHVPVPIEKDEFNKIIPESKKGPQVRQSFILRRLQIDKQTNKQTNKQTEWQNYFKGGQWIKPQKARSKECIRCVFISCCFLGLL